MALKVYFPELSHVLTDSQLANTGMEVKELVRAALPLSGSNRFYQRIPQICSEAHPVLLKTVLVRLKPCTVLVLTLLVCARKISVWLKTLRLKMQKWKSHFLWQMNQTYLSLHPNVLAKLESTFSVEPYFAQGRAQFKEGVM